MINFLNKKVERNIIYVLDFLLQVSIDGESINKARNIDLDFYNLLNRPEINQNIFHVGCLPTSRKNEAVNNEFAGFIENLSLFIEYDTMTDFIWTKVVEDDIKKKKIHQKIVTTREEILNYLLNKEAISDGEYSRLLGKDIKKLN